MKPGTIIKIATVIGETGRGRSWVLKVPCHTDLGRFLLPKENVVTTLPRGKDVNGLIVTGKDSYGNNLVALMENGGYFEKLIEYYWPRDWRRGTHYQPWEHWFDKWVAECNSTNFFTRKFLLSGHELPLPGKEKWYELKTQDYRLPVRGYKDLDSLTGESLFFPTYYGSGVALRSVYRTDICNGFPIAYGANLKGVNGLPDKAVHIFLHGYVNPAKWHYGVWQHMFGEGKGGEEEKRLWEEVLGHSINTAEIFEGQECSLNREGRSCDEGYCVRNALFSTVHAGIRERCKEYLEQAVILLEKEETCPNNEIRTIRVIEVPYRKAWIIWLDYGCIPILPVKRNAVATLALKGICFDWNAEKPTLHITPQTLFFSCLSDGARKRRALSRHRGGRPVQDTGGNLVYDGDIIRWSKA